MSKHKQAGSLSASNADSASVNDMAMRDAPKKDPVASGPKKIDSHASLSNLIQTTSPKPGAVKSKRSFITQSSRSNIQEITFEKPTDTKDELDKLDKKEIKTLEKITGVEINNDADLEKASTALRDKVSEAIDSNYDLADSSKWQTLDEDKVTTVDENKINMANKLDQLAPKLDLSSELLSGNFSTPMIADELGEDIDGIPSDLPYDVVKNMSDLAETICPGSKLSMTNYGNNVGLMNALLALAAKLGLMDLIRKLVDCFNLYKNNGPSVLAQQIPIIAQNGDYNTMDGILGIIGPSKVSNPVDTSTKLISNIDKDDKDATPKVNNILDTLEIPKTELTEVRLGQSDVRMVSKYKLDRLGDNDNIKGNLVGKDQYALYKASPFN